MLFLCYNICMTKDFVINNKELMKEWNWEKNNSLGVFPDKITCGNSRIKVWWKCDKCGHEWLSICNNRNKGQGCPACANKVLISGKNDLQTLFPKIARKWNYELNKEKPNEIFSHCNKKVWWICDKDKRHVFQAKVCHMTEGRIVCPICANQKIIVGVNDLATTNPELLKEWDYDKNKITPQQVTYGVNKKVWWKCKKGHNWQATVGSRAGGQKTSCPYCKNELKVSIREKAVSYYLSKYFRIEEGKHFNWLGSREIDIYIPQLNLGIEYDGRQWHKNIERDLKKDKLCLNNNLKLIRIREEGCPKYETSSYLIYVKIDKDPILQLKEIIKKTFDFINNNFGTHLNLTPNIDNDYMEILNKTLTISKDNSIANNILINEWNYDRNKVNPEYISLGSEKRVWWKCKKGHEWQAVVYSRTGSMKCGCPYCAGQKVLSGDNDLETLFPEIAKEWNYIKNGNIKPNQIRPQTNKKYWWKCDNCGYEWQATPSDRVRGRNCPKCARQIIISSHYKKILNIDTGIVYVSVKYAAEELKISAGSISNCCRGVSKTAGGYHWKFVDTKKD